MLKHARYTEHLHGQLAQQTLLKLRLCLAETQLRRPRLLLYGIICLNQYQSTSKQCQHLAVAVVGSKANEPTSEDGERVNQTKLPTQYLYLRQHQIQSRSTQSSRIAHSYIRYSLLRVTRRWHSCTRRSKPNNPQQFTITNVIINILSTLSMRQLVRANRTYHKLPMLPCDVTKYVYYS